MQEKSEVLTLVCIISILISAIAILYQMLGYNGVIAKYFFFAVNITVMIIILYWNGREK